MTVRRSYLNVPYAVGRPHISPSLGTGRLLARARCAQAGVRSFASPAGPLHTNRIRKTATKSNVAQTRWGMGPRRPHHLESHNIMTAHRPKYLKTYRDQSILENNILHFHQPSNIDSTSEYVQSASARSRCDSYRLVPGHW